MSKRLSLSTGIKLMAVLDTLVLLALAWVVVSSDLFS
jgi:hypothetical protein